MIPRGIRNNNPGNIIKSGIHWNGEKESLDEKVFEVFDTAAHGLEVLCKLLLNYQVKHELRTVRGIISRWSATDQAAYIKNVARRLGVGVDVALNLRSAGTLVALATAIVWQENGQQPYPAAMIQAAANVALGVNT